MVELRSPYRFPDQTEMENSTPPTWIQWISREVNDLCNELTQAIVQEMNETLSEFRPILEDKELKEVDQPNLKGFEMPQAGNEVREVEVWGEEGNSPQQELRKEQPQSQTEDLNVTQINIHQVTGVTVSNEQRKEVKNKHPRSQPMQDASEDTHGQGTQISQNHADGSTKNTVKSNVENTANNNPASNVHNTVNNHPSIHQISIEV